MKLLVSSYYGANIRFFDYVIKEVSDKVNVTPFFINLYPSSYFYMKKFNYNGIFVKKIKQIKKVKILDNEFYEEIIKTELLLVGEENKKRLLKLAYCYYDYIYKYVKKNNIDCILASSDEFMIAKILKAISKKEKIKILYFEQGPFGTTILDSKGVNNNVSFKNKFSTNDLPKFNFDKKVEKFYVEDKKYKYFKILDYIFMSNKILGLDLYRKEKFFEILINRMKKSDKKSLIPPQNKYFLLILQVPYDVQMLINTPLYKSFIEIVKDIYKSIPNNIELIIREHPLYMGPKKNFEIYNFIKDKSNIRIDNCLDLNIAIKNAEAIIVNNSTVGLEVLKNYKTLVVLGDSYYDSDEICLKLTHRNYLKQLLNKALTYCVDEKKINRFFNNLFENELIHTHFLDKEYNDSDKIVKKFLKVGFRNEKI